MKGIRKQSFLLINSGICITAAIVAFSAVMMLQRSDFGPHIRTSITRAETGVGLFRNLFQDLVAFAINSFHADPKLLAAFVTGFLELLFVAAVIFVLSKWLPQNRSKVMHVLSVCCVVFASAPYYFVEGTFYRGISGINTWHNPTSFAVKPFIVLSFFLIVVLIEHMSTAAANGAIATDKASKKHILLLLIALTVALYLMTYGKISGLTVIAPATMVFVFCWWMKSKFSITRLRFSLLIAATFIPALILFFSLLLFRYFPSGGASQAVFNGGANLLSSSGTTILLRTVWILMLPIFITLTRIKSILHNKGFVLAWLTYFFAFVVRNMFEETGPRSSHGNNSWGRHYALVLLLIVSVTEINKMWHDLKTAETRSAKDTAVFVISIILMLFYLISGLLYIINFLYNGNYRI